MAKPNIIFLDTETIGDIPELQNLQSLGNYTSFPSTAHADRISRIGNHEIVITNKVLIDREVMDACSGMKLVCLSATGMNNIDLEYAATKGIQVKNVAGYSTESVVQHTFALLFYLMNRMSYHDRYVQSGQYARSTLFTHLGRTFYELDGKKFGIIGLGTIGRRVAEVASVFGAEVTYFSTTGKNLDSPYKHTMLDDLLAESDVVSIHCPLTEQTKNLLDLPHLQRMQPHAILINTGRGGIVNEEALAYAIDHDLIGGAGLDVLSKEPPALDNPLLQVKNQEKLVITPHIAWATVEARTRLIHGVIRNIEEYLVND